MTRIVLLHATTVAFAPVQAAFAAIWPEAKTVNLLDDALTIDRARDPGLTEAMSQRFVSLCRYGATLSAHGLLVTCSAFGPAIEAAAAELALPVVKPNAPMFDAAIRSGHNLATIATFEPAVTTMEDEFKAQSGASGAKLTTFVVPEAMAALSMGDEDGHNRLVAEKAAALSGFDAIMLAHFSTSRAADHVRRRTTMPILTAPEAAVREMQRLVVSI